MTSDERDGFWRWFARSVLPSLTRFEVPAEEIIQNLDRRMESLGLSWELGPAPDGSRGWAFAVSFGADMNRFALAEALVNSAPSMAGCQVLLGKPPKRWNGVLDLPSGDEWVRFHTADWCCYLLPMADGVAVVVSPTGVRDGVDEDVLLLAASIAVQSELGELIFVRQVRDLSVVDPDRTEGMPGIRCSMGELGSTFAAG